MKSKSLVKEQASLRTPKILYNNLFKSDSQRLAFLLCVALRFVFKVVCGSIGIALLTP
ncbi:DUF3265 domain-containing protein [Vibrio parahaemolyticus]|nr:DUF3265 domain-containing protein [Vibrio parahaemolyticus]